MGFECFKGRTVLVTGSRGFKGIWLSSWLKILGARVIGYSLSPVGHKSLYCEAGKECLDIDIEGDVTDHEQLKAVFDKYSIDFVFHLAAQALVSVSATNPLSTIKSNTYGTASLLECVRTCGKKIVCVVITSDKCYENQEWEYAYRENDLLGGKDIYSGSKAAAEIIFSSYCRTFFVGNPDIKTVSARAGNVIGGGDWSTDRLVPDIIRAWQDNRTLKIRMPNATRPWQHVLEPIYGYLTLASQLWVGILSPNQSFNFGPGSASSRSVEDLLKEVSRYIDICVTISEDSAFKEASLLALSTQRAERCLQWKAMLSFPETIRMTIDWYRDFYSGRASASELITSQIAEYSTILEHPIGA